MDVDVFHCHKTDLRFSLERKYFENLLKTQGDSCFRMTNQSALSRARNRALCVKGRRSEKQLCSRHETHTPTASNTMICTLTYSIYIQRNQGEDRRMGIPPARQGTEMNTSKVYASPACVHVPVHCRGQTKRGKKIHFF